MEIEKRTVVIFKMTIEEAHNVFLKSCYDILKESLDCFDDAKGVFEGLELFMQRQFTQFGKDGFLPMTIDIKPLEDAMAAGNRIEVHIIDKEEVYVIKHEDINF